MSSIVGGIVRAFLTAAAGYAAGKGIDINPLVGPETQAAIVTLFVAIWSIVAKIRAGKATPPAS